VAFRTAVVLIALAIAPAADAKLVPAFDRAVAARGDRVAVELGYGVDAYRPPLEVSLVRVDDEPYVRGRSDRRLVRIGMLPRDATGIGAGRLTFLVTVPPGRYTLAVWFRGYGAPRWRNATAGLWRGRRGAVLRVVGPARG
jgi:hypothetical protein